MRRLEPDREADVYAISCRLGPTKIGVAADARERCRAMQVGSPVELELAGSYRFRSAQDAYAVAAEVKRQLAERHERGGWYRVRPEQVRQVLGNRDRVKLEILWGASLRREPVIVENAASSSCWRQIPGRAPLPS